VFSQDRETDLTHELYPYYVVVRSKYLVRVPDIITK